MKSKIRQSSPAASQDLDEIIGTYARSETEQFTFKNTDMGFWDITPIDDNHLVGTTAQQNPIQLALFVFFTGVHNVTQPSRVFM